MPRTLPEDVKRAGGHFRPCRDTRETTDPIIGTPFPKAPRRLSKGARAVWKEVQAVMSEYGLITEADAHTLARYAELESQFRDDPVGFPVGKLANLRLLGNDLYLAPEVRAKVGKIQPEKQEENEFDSL